MDRERSESIPPLLQWIATERSNPSPALSNLQKCKLRCQMCVFLMRFGCKVCTFRTSIMCAVVAHVTSLVRHYAAFYLKFGGKIGFVGLEIRILKCQSFSKSSRKWCEKTSPP